MTDLQKKSIKLWREHAWDLHWKLRKVEDALREIAKVNNRRDRFSSEIDAIILNALGDENENT